jgi:hypothetical protein
MYKICFYVPIDNAAKVKDAMFLAGAGKYKNYDCCSFESMGTGQFRPLENSNPTIGQINIIEKVSELKVEMICEKSIIKEAIKAMKAAHPYEEVAYDVIEILEF